MKNLPQPGEILELLNDVIWSLEPWSFETLYVNPAVESVYGVTAESFLSNRRLRFEMIDAADSTQVLEELGRLEQQGRLQLEYRIQRPDGQTRLLWERARLVRDATGAPVRIDTIVSDITSWRSAEEALRRLQDESAERAMLHAVELARTSEALQQESLARRHVEKVKQILAAMAEQLAEASSPKQAALVILDAAYALFGWDAALVDIYDSEQQRFHGLVRFDRVNGILVDVAPVAGGTPFTPLRKGLFEQGALLQLRGDDELGSREDFVTFGDPTRKSASLMFAPIRKGERKIGLLSVQSYTREAYSHKDLELLEVLASYCCNGLERAFAEATARETERRLRLVMSKLPAVMWTTNDDLRITSATGAGLELLGRGTAEELTGKALSEVLDSAEAARCLEQLHRQALAGTAGSATVQWGAQQLLCHVEPLADQSGQTASCLGVGYVMVR